MGAFTFCLITINNFSGKNQTVKVTYQATEELFWLYRLDNTDEMQWKTIQYMENLMKAESEAAGSSDDDHKHDSQSEYTIISGMGKGVYVMNLD